MSKQLKYLKTNSTAKVGVGYIRSIVEHHNCIFHEINASNDLGVDATIEIIIDETPISKFVAIQVKSGKSYYNKKSDICTIPIENHFSYWVNHPLPVYGIVYIPEYENAYWIDIKKYLEEYPEAKIISYDRSLANQITLSNFFIMFVPQLLNKPPEIDYSFAKELFLSDRKDEFYLGLYVLHKKFTHENGTWLLFVKYFKEQPIEKIPSILIYILAHLPWHPDIWYNSTMTNEAQQYGKSLLKQEFGRIEILKLLEFIDEESSIARGEIGQSVEAIISILENFRSYLEEIISNESIELRFREASAIIYAYNFGVESIVFFNTINSKDFFVISELIDHLKKYEDFNPYS